MTIGEEATLIQTVKFNKKIKITILYNEFFIANVFLKNE